MSPIWITYIGFLIAVLSIAWAVFTLGRRFSKRKKFDASIMSSWVPLSPSQAETENVELGDVPDVDPHPNSEQNGHYSGSKKS